MKLDPWIQLSIMVFNAFLNCFSCRMVAEFGYGGYDDMFLTGKFAVGEKTFFSKKFGNRVNVFYPIDKDYEEKEK